MDHCLFISDLHLCDSRPHISQAFIQFLEKTAVKAEALYILGDLFEYWAGDDVIAINNIKTSTTGQNHSSAGLQANIHALHRFVSNGISVFFIHGNRDFLIAKGFEKATGVKILPDPSLITLYGKPVLLSHGDALCTDDIAYQNFRTEVRSEAWQAQFLSQPLSVRIAYIEQLRTQSEHAKSTKSMQIMDVNSAAVNDLLREFSYPPIFIHGHTHRPKKHVHEIDGNICERWVLGDWYEQGSYLKLDKNGCQARMLAA